MYREGVILCITVLSFSVLHGEEFSSIDSPVYLEGYANNMSHILSGCNYGDRCKSRGDCSAYCADCHCGTCVLSRSDDPCPCPDTLTCNRCENECSNCKPVCSVECPCKCGINIATSDGYMSVESTQRVSTKSLNMLDSPIASNTVRIFNDRDDRATIILSYVGCAISYDIEHLVYVDTDMAGVWTIVTIVGNGFVFNTHRHIGKIIRIHNTYATSDGNKLDLSGALYNPPAY